ncbi:hypothetical protein PBI_EDTHERSON_91 [Mycobacterium phage Edtherson]|uniref:hypothetical protein n=1 Tax=Mycobacterium phage Edtherson TaxID=1567468 RepID=UPI000572A970|nr:hypothetical protein PBI_EDTHERSON_91 [Mycobacterium phage Edtherson]AJA43110.1 hypothetical protein PBI_EDTHERSON_91 [Mycobacterium phage Edtherson]
MPAPRLVPSHRALMPIAGPSQPRRATITRLSIDRPRRPVSSRQRTDRPLEPRDRPRTPGLAPSKADPHRHPPARSKPRRREASDELDPRSIDPIGVERELRSRNVGWISKLSHPPRCGAPSIPSSHRIRSTSQRRARRILGTEGLSHRVQGVAQAGGAVG